MILVAVFFGILGLIIWFYAMWIMMLRLFALLRVFAADKIGNEENTFAKAYQKIKSIQWAILGVFSLGTVVSLVVTLAWTVAIVLTAVAVRFHVLPSWVLASLVIAEVFAMLASVMLISIIYWLAYNDIVLDGENVKLAVARAWQLALPNFWRIIVFMILLITVTLLITWPLSIPLIAFSIIEAFVKGGQFSTGQDFGAHLTEELASFGSKAPFYRLALAQAWETVISMITWPINLFAWAFFYQDLKKRALSLDLVKRLDELKTKTEAGGGQLGEGIQ
jgi:hypothetical protein